MILFFTGAKIVFFGQVLKELEEGHAVLMRRAFAQYQQNSTLPPQTDLGQMILGNQRMDMPHKREDGTVPLWSLGIALLKAQTLPKYHHGMRQAWHHPSKGLPQVQHELYKRLRAALTTSEPQSANELFGAAMHTLQDTYTLGHTEREDNSDPCSPLVRLHYSPSKAHPLISPRDTVWANKDQTELTPEAQAAITATVAALDLGAELWKRPPQQLAVPLSAFINQYVPIRAQPFQAKI